MILVEDTQPGSGRTRICEPFDEPAVRSHVTA
jgi:hypothetical protein